MRRSTFYSTLGLTVPPGSRRAGLVAHWFTLYGIGLGPGDYPFFCSVHPNMEGTLTAQ